jgi:hypothetical protein
MAPRRKRELTDASLNSALTEVNNPNARLCRDYAHCVGLKATYNSLGEGAVKNRAKMQAISEIAESNRSPEDAKAFKTWEFDSQYIANPPNTRGYCPAQHPEDIATWRTFELGFSSQTSKRLCT